MYGMNHLNSFRVWTKLFK